MAVMVMTSPGAYQSRSVVRSSLTGERSEAWQLRAQNQVALDRPDAALITLADGILEVEDHAVGSVQAGVDEELGLVARQVEPAAAQALGVVRDHRQGEVRVGRGVTVAGEVLGARGDPAGLHYGICRDEKVLLHLLDGADKGLGGDQVPQAQPRHCIQL